MHTEKRGSWYKEGALTAFTGFLYGGSNTIVGHPFDTIKTKMQAEAGHMSSKSRGPSYKESIKMVYNTQGLGGFYKGWAPPFCGSVIYRSVQFSVYEMFYTKFENDEGMKREIPGTFGLTWRVLLGGMLASSSRAIIESPFEYAKVKR